MSENPQRENGHVDIANELVEALSRINLSAYESRVLWCVFRKTYGWQKKEDWIALSQIVLMTGLHKAHASRAKAKLLARKLVTQTGNKIAFNKFYSQWKELPKQVTVTPIDNKVTQTGNQTPAYSGNQGVPVEAPQKTTYTKDNLTKESGSAKKMTDDEAGARFRSLLTEQQWCDDHYANKTWEQGSALRSDDRVEFMRKVRLVVATVSARPGFAKKIYHEVAGLVNDRGAMATKLTPQEKEAREIFREEMGQDEN